jgi:WD40 repeat protein
MSSTPESPYKGLSAFGDSEFDALMFFGREREREIVVDNLIASRLTVLYGPSGVGKSSLLRAGVARSLRELPEHPLVVVVSRWSEDPAATLSKAVAAAAGLQSNGSPVAALELAQSDRDVYLVLDQAEEYFLYHADDRGPGTLAEALPAVLAAPFRVNVLISLREDALAKLDRFTGEIPGLFANTLRLDRLDREAARAAVVRPVERYAELTGDAVTVEPALVDRVLDEVGIGRIEPALGGLGTVGVAGDGARIEAPYLQLVMQRLWEEERATGSDVLRVETLERLGGAQSIVEEHLEGAMAALTPAEQDVASRIFNHLVTPSGTKIAHESSDLANFGRVLAADLAPVLTTLTGRRILRSFEEGDEVRYEIFHDVLAQPVLAWRTRHEADRELERQKEAADRRHRRLLAVIAVSAVLVGLMACVTAYALTQRNEAEKQAARAKALTAVAVEQKRIAQEQKAEADRQRDVAEAQRKKAEQAQQQANAQAAAAEEAQQEAEASQQAAEQNAAAAETAEQQANQSAAEATQSQQQAQAEAQKALTEKAKAERARAAATRAAEAASARALAARSLALVATRPLEALRLALAAARREAAQPQLAENVLRTSVAASKVRAVLVGAGGPVSAASFSPDGRVALVVARRARLFDARTGRPIQTLDDPGAVRAASFSPDGNSVVTADSDETARIWAVGQSISRLLTGGTPTILRGHTKAVVSATFSSSGRFVVTASDDRTARVWNVRTGGQVSVLQHEGPVRSAVFSPDEKLVVTVTRVAKTGRLLALLFDADSGEPLLTFDQRGVRSAIFAPDGSSVVTTSNGSTGIWSLSGDQIAKLDQGGDIVTAAFGPDATELVTASESGDACVWQRVDGAWTRDVQLVGPLNFLTGASFSPDGRFVLVSSLDRTVRIYRRNGMEVVVLAGHTDGITTASWRPDGRSVLSASKDGTARIWAPGTQDLLELVGKTNDGPIQRASFSPDGRLAVSAGADGTARILNVARHAELHVLRHDLGVNDAEFSPDGKLVVTASDDSTARTWRADGTLLHVLHHDGPVLRAIFSPDGARVATTSADHSVRIWRAKDGRLLHTLVGHADAVLDVAFSPNGRFLGSAGDSGDMTARIWSADGEEVRVLHHGGPVLRVSFSPDSSLVLTASSDSMARLWSVDTGKLVHRLRGHTNVVRDAEFSPDGKLVVTASDDRDGRIWSVATGRPIALLRGHFAGPQAASFSPDGRWVVTTGRTAVGLWDSSTGRFFAPTGLVNDPFIRGHATGRPLSSAVFAPDGRRILTAGSDGTVRTYLCALCGTSRDLVRIAVARLSALEKYLTAAERRRYLSG